MSVKCYLYYTPFRSFSSKEGKETTESNESKRNAYVNQLDSQRMQTFESRMAEATKFNQPVIALIGQT